MKQRVENRFALTQCNIWKRRDRMINVSEIVTIRCDSFVENYTRAITNLYIWTGNSVVATCAIYIYIYIYNFSHVRKPVVRKVARSSLLVRDENYTKRTYVRCY